MSKRILIGLTAVAAGAAVLWACTQDDGDRCQLHDDCSSGYCCICPNEDDGVCMAEAECDLPTLCGTISDGGADADADGDGGDVEPADEASPEDETSDVEEALPDETDEIEDAVPEVDDADAVEETSEDDAA